MREIEYTFKLSLPEGQNTKLEELVEEELEDALYSSSMFEEPLPPFEIVYSRKVITP